MPNRAIPFKKRWTWRGHSGKLEFLEQPTPADDLLALRQVTENSPVPILADESLHGPACLRSPTSAAHGSPPNYPAADWIAPADWTPSPAQISPQW
jgi:hypothetical protein